MLERFKSLIFVAITIAIGSGVLVLLTNRPAPTVIQIYPPHPTATPLPIRVYVTGAVKNPLTTYALPYNSRVEDAILAAGGVLPNANLLVINLALPLKDGDQINVPFIPPTATITTTPLPITRTLDSGSGTVQASATPPAVIIAAATATPVTVQGQSTLQSVATKANPANVGMVKINSATLEELQTLPGVGPVLAQRIIDYRTKNGAFKSMDDLDKVSGVGAATLEKWQGLINFE